MVAEVQCGLLDVGSPFYSRRGGEAALAGMLSGATTCALSCERKSLDSTAAFLGRREEGRRQREEAAEFDEAASHEQLVEPIR